MSRRQKKQWNAGFKAGHEASYTAGFKAGRADERAKFRLEADKAAKRKHPGDCDCDLCRTVRRVSTTCTHTEYCGCILCVVALAEAASVAHKEGCLCVRCFLIVMWETGYDALETDLIKAARHEATCGCQPCAILRAVAVVGAKNG